MRTKSPAPGTKTCSLRETSGCETLQAPDLPQDFLFGEADSLGRIIHEMELMEENIQENRVVVAIVDKLGPLRNRKLVGRKPLRLIRSALNQATHDLLPPFEGGRGNATQVLDNRPHGAID